ncbi:MAG: hypothetical protein J6K74_00660 [Marinifilaceae bacterium]|nr:hypothetical protein [Marinifilaceae bacterium]
MQKINPPYSIFCPYCSIALYVKCPQCGVEYSSQYPACSLCGTNREAYYEQQRQELENEIKRKEQEQIEKIMETEEYKSIYSFVERANYYLNYRDYLFYWHFTILCILVMVIPVVMIIMGIRWDLVILGFILSIIIDFSYCLYLESLLTRKYDTRIAKESNYNEEITSRIVSWLNKEHDIYHRYYIAESKLQELSIEIYKEEYGIS